MSTPHLDTVYTETIDGRSYRWRIHVENGKRALLLLDDPESADVATELFSAIAERFKHPVVREIEAEALERRLRDIVEANASVFADLDPASRFSEGLVRSLPHRPSRSKCKAHRRQAKGWRQ